jgi:hypothetical protein
MATAIMNAGPGLEALMKFGHNVPTRYPHTMPVVPTMTPG